MSGKLRKYQIIISIIVFIFSLIIGIKQLNKKEIIVFLNGDNEVSLALKNEYEDEGFSFKVNGEDKKVEYEVIDGINYDELGVYNYEYLIHYEDEEYLLKRVVSVIDDVAPVIEVANKTVYVTTCKSKTKNTLSYTAHDNYDGVLTKNVKEKWGTDTLTLSVSDSSGNITTTKLKVVNKKNVNTLELKGKSSIYIAQNSEYEDMGAYVTDSCGEKTTEDIEVEGQVDVTTPGVYYITYKYEDISKKRMVEVYDESKANIYENKGDKIVYLTFDDGPGQYTKQLLDILDKYHVKATFFVTNQFKAYVPLIKEEHDRGHAVAIHTYSHKWSVYDSLESYLSDFNKMNEVIKTYTGEYSKIFRFPGGSSNTISKGHSKGVVGRIASYLTEKGYVYFDWNLDSTDAAGGSPSQIKNNVINGLKHNTKKASVVLMHDIKKNTIEVIEDIISWGVENGYTFKTLNTKSPTVHHTINNK